MPAGRAEILRGADQLAAVEGAAGSGDWLDWIEAIPFDETKRYVQHVLENAVIYDLINPQRAMSTGNARLSWYIGNKRPG